MGLTDPESVGTGPFDGRKPLPDPAALAAFKRAWAYAVLCQGQDTGDRMQRAAMRLLGATDEEVRAFDEWLYREEQRWERMTPEERDRARGR